MGTVFFSRLKMPIIYGYSIGFFFLVSCANAQNQLVKFTYKKVPASYFNRGDISQFKQQVNQLASSAYDLTLSLPIGFVKDGSKDYTAHLQKGINEHKNVIFPDFPVMVSDKGLNIGSGKNLLFRSNSILLLKASNKKSYEIIRIREAKNVNIFYPRIVGDRKKHIGTEGEWGMGIDIRASSNINIINPSISECWGDGIYLGQLKYIVNKNINIYNAALDYNRRNGISVICVDGLRLIAPVISNSTGASPMTAIDIEPNTNKDIINNIVIDRPITINNSKCGILLALRALTNGGNRKEVNISINDHVDEGSFIGFNMGWFKPDKEGYPLAGRIQVINPRWNNNVEAFRARKTYGYSPDIVFRNVRIEKSAIHSDKLKSTGNTNTRSVDEDNKVMYNFISGEKKIKLNKD